MGHWMGQVILPSWSALDGSFSGSSGSLDCYISRVHLFALVQHCTGHWCSGLSSRCLLLSDCHSVWDCHLVIVCQLSCGIFRRSVLSPGASGIWPSLGASSVWAQSWSTHAGPCLLWLLHVLPGVFPHVLLSFCRSLSEVLSCLAALCYARFFFWVCLQDFVPPMPECVFFCPSYASDLGVCQAPPFEGSGCASLYLVFLCIFVWWGFTTFLLFSFTFGGLPGPLST